MLAQHSALIAIVDCHISNTALWQERVEQRAKLDQDSERSHKPQSWAALQQLIAGCDSMQLCTSSMQAPSMAHVYHVQI